MVQEVGYWDKDNVYTEGPFVISIYSGEWRVLVDNGEGNDAAGLEDFPEIIKLIKSQKFKFSIYGFSISKNEAIRLCEWLNSLEELGYIIHEKRKYNLNWYLSDDF